MTLLHLPSRQTHAELTKPGNRLSNRALLHVIKSPLPLLQPSTLENWVDFSFRGGKSINLWEEYGNQYYNNTYSSRWLILNGFTKNGYNSIAQNLSRCIELIWLMKNSHLPCSKQGNAFFYSVSSNKLGKYDHIFFVSFNLRILLKD